MGDQMNCMADNEHSRDIILRPIHFVMTKFVNASIKGNFHPHDIIIHLNQCHASTPSNLIMINFAHVSLAKFNFLCNSATYSAIVSVSNIADCVAFHSIEFSFHSRIIMQ